MIKFSPVIAQTFRQLGWTVASYTAFRKEGDLNVRVWTDGKWNVARGGNTVRRGQESNATYAAMEANEAAWAAAKKGRNN